MTEQTGQVSKDWESLLCLFIHLFNIYSIYSIPDTAQELIEDTGMSKTQLLPSSENSQSRRNNNSVLKYEWHANLHFNVRTEEGWAPWPG
jgi:hypothetical protein